MLQKQAIPLLEYDAAKDAVINPRATAVKLSCDTTMPKGCVMAFLHDAVTDLVREEQAEMICTIPSTSGGIPVYKVVRDGQEIALLICPVGAPMAAGIMEEVHALGVDCFISCGGVGVLDRNLPVGHVLLPERALRDEGTSYHYLPPARFVKADAQVLAAMEKTLSERGENYTVVTAWTTDAFYRETRDKVNLRREEGCSCVEMECAALMAVAQHRGLSYGAMLYAGDNLDTEQWDNRGWHSHVRRSWLVDAALAAVASLLSAREEAKAEA